MRLIDADALLTDRMKSKYYHLPNGDIAIPIIDIEHAPTAEPKVGKWISVSSFEAFGGDEICWEIRGNPTAFHYCSACKEQAYVDEFGNEILSKCCPNCGAKMERSE